MTCSVVGCDRAPHARGWCSMHYKRWAAHGDPTIVQSPREYPEGTTCSVLGCDSASRITRGMCVKHYVRWQRHGDPTVVKGKRYVDPHEIEAGFREFAQVNQRTACWRWLGAMGGNGRPYLGHNIAYRVAYELSHGPIAVGLEIDHLCGNGWCVNPGHLEPVTAQENKRRMSLLRPDMCGKGHVRPVGERCRTCDQTKERRRTERRRRQRVTA